MLRSFTTTLIGFCVIMPGPGGAAPVSARDMRGRTISLPAPPRRIVSLAPAVTEILFAIGSGSRVVGVTSYCDYPREARTRPKVGDFRASAEKVLAQKPDLVIASVSANAQSIPQIERLRIPVFAIDTRTVTQVLSSIRSIGSITGQTVNAARLTERMEERIRATRKAVAGAREKPRTLVVVDVNGPWIAGRDTYMDDLISIAGGDNLGAIAGSGWIRYSPEKAVIQRPEVVLVSDRMPQRLKSLPGWSQIPAVINNRVHADLPIAFVRPGPRLPEALESVARFLHPDRFPPARR